MENGYQPKGVYDPRIQPTGGSSVSKPSGGTSVGKLTVDVDMSQIDAAIEKAERLLALMAEAEAAAERIAARKDAYVGTGGFRTTLHPQETVVDR